MVIVIFMVWGNLRISKPACQVLVLSVDISVHVHLITVLRGERHSREVCLKSQMSSGLLPCLEIKISANPNTWAKTFHKTPGSCMWI